MNELDARARSLLNAARCLGEPSDEQIRQVLSAFEAEREPATRVPGAQQRPALTTLPARRTATRLTRVLLAAIVLGSGLAAAATWSGVWRKTPELPREQLEATRAPSAALETPVAHVNPRTLPEQTPVPETDFPELVELNPKPDLPVLTPFGHFRPEPKREATPGAVVRPPLHSASDPSSLNPELELIVAARDLLHTDPVRAAALANEHSARFPNGALGQEASAIAALAECQRGLPPRRAKQHLARWPQSFFNLRIRKVCTDLSNVQIAPGPTTDSSSETFAPATQGAEGSF